MFEKNTKVMLKNGETRLDAILEATEYYTYCPKDKELVEQCGTASWEESTQQTALRITLVNQCEIICNSRQKFYVDYEYYGTKILEAGKLQLGDSILCLTEEHYYQWFEDEDSDNLNFVFRGSTIKSLEEISAVDLEFYDTYVQCTRTMIVNRMIACC